MFEVVHEGRYKTAAVMNSSSTHIEIWTNVWVVDKSLQFKQSLINKTSLFCKLFYVSLTIQCSSQIY